MSVSVMSLLPLVVQILIPLSPEEEAALLDACSRANPDDPCVRLDVGGSDDGKGETVQDETVTTEADEINAGRPEFNDAEQKRSQQSLGARVTGLGHHRFFIEVQGLTDRERYASARLTFAPGDDAKERARSIGLSIGTLATTLQAEEPLQEPVGEKPTQPAASLNPQRVEPSEPESPAVSRWLLHGAAGVEINPSWARLGPAFEVGAVWAPRGHLAAAFSGTLGFVPGRQNIPDLLHGGASLGVGYMVDVGGHLLIPQASFGFESLMVSLSDSDLLGSSQSRVSATSRVALAWLVPIVPRVFIQLEPSVEFVLSPTRVFVNEQDLGSVGTTRLVFRVGVAFGDVDDKN